MRPAGALKDQAGSAARKASASEEGKPKARGHARKQGHSPAIGGFSQACGSRWMIVPQSPRPGQQKRNQESRKRHRWHLSLSQSHRQTCLNTASQGTDTCLRSERRARVASTGGQGRVQGGARRRRGSKVHARKQDAQRQDGRSLRRQRTSGARRAGNLRQGTEHAREVKESLAS